MGGRGAVVGNGNAWTWRTVEPPDRTSSVTSANPSTAKPYSSTFTRRPTGSDRALVSARRNESTTYKA